MLRSARLRRLLLLLLGIAGGPAAGCGDDSSTSDATDVEADADAGADGAALVVLNVEDAPAVRDLELADTPFAGASSLAERTGFGATVAVDGGRAAVTVPARSCGVFTAP